MSGLTFDAVLATPPDDRTNEYAEEDALERDYEEHMQALQTWVQHASGRQLKIGVKLIEEAIRQRIADAAAELRALEAPARKQRKDAGKPRQPRAVSVLPANEQADIPFAEAK